MVRTLSDIRAELSPERRADGNPPAADQGLALDEYGLSESAY